jgi:hypothetical protein
MQTTIKRCIMAYIYNNKITNKEIKKIKKRSKRIIRNFKNGDKLKLCIDRENIYISKNEVKNDWTRDILFVIVDHISENKKYFTVKKAFTDKTFKNEIKPQYYAWYNFSDVVGYFGNETND